MDMAALVLHNDILSAFPFDYVFGERKSFFFGEWDYFLNSWL